MPAITREQVYAFEANVASDHLATRRATRSLPLNLRYDSSFTNATHLGASFWVTNEVGDLYLVNWTPRSLLEGLQRTVSARVDGVWGSETFSLARAYARLSALPTDYTSDAQVREVIEAALTRWVVESQTIGVTVTPSITRLVTGLRVYLPSRTQLPSAATANGRSVLTVPANGTLPRQERWFYWNGENGQLPNRNVPATQQEPPPPAPPAPPPQPPQPPQPPAPQPQPPAPQPQPQPPQPQPLPPEAAMGVTRYDVTVLSPPASELPAGAAMLPYDPWVAVSPTTIISQSRDGGRSTQALFESRVPVGASVSVPLSGQLRFPQPIGNLNYTNAIDVREGQLTTTVIQLRYRNGRLVGEVITSVMTPLAPPVVPPRTAAVQQASMSPGVKTFLGLGLLFGAIWVFDQTQPPNKRIIKFP